MARIVLLLWEHCITLISKGMCQDERVPLCLLSAVENGQEGGGRSGVFIKWRGREGTAGAPELSLANLPSSQANALAANTLFEFTRGDGLIAPESEILYHSTGMSQSGEVACCSVAPGGSGT